LRPAAPAPFILLFLSLTLAMPASAQSWDRVVAADRYTAVYLDTESVRVLDGGIRVAVSVINYQTANGNDESLLAGTLYDCSGNRKRDQFVRKSDSHWGNGIEIRLSGEESRWFDVRRHTIGDSLQRAVCSSDKSGNQIGK
jgi:hypothetical protein